MKHKKKLLTFLLISSIGSAFSRPFPINILKKVTKNVRRKKKQLHRKFINNFHKVDNCFYRSAQLSGKELKYVIRRYKIKTIINLRGENRQASWWKTENRIAKAHNIKFYNIQMKTNKLPHPSNLKKYLDAIEKAPHPILVHCRRGADRTGEAAAIWLLVKRRKSKKEALKQLSIKYQHFKANKPAKRFLIRMWRGRHWALNDYNPRAYPCYYSG